MSDELYRRAQNKRAKGLEKFFGELELAVMEIIWNQELATVSDVLAILNQQQRRQLAYTTVMTIMSRLVEKGWLVAEKKGRAYSYRAVYSRQEAEGATVSAVVRALVEDFGNVAMAQFLRELDEVDLDQLARLARLADEVEQDDEIQRGGQ